MKRNARSSRRVADATTSNAGDDFHLQWAARRALSLLLPGTQLTGLLPESPTPADSAVLDSTGEKLLAIDLTEYFGGNSFAEATRVVYSQLKYSTTNAHAPWTISALTTSKKGTAAGSVLYRFADLFQSHVEKFGRDSAIAKLNIWLVSNRPCDVGLETALAEVREVLSDGKPMQSSQLVRKVSTTTSGVVSQLKNACTQLQSSEFCDFLRVLDLSSHCGELSRLRQELALTKDIGQHGYFDTSRQRNDLKSLIWDYSQPGSHEVITADHVARTFRVLSKDVLFPAPNKIERLSNPVPRKQAAEIAKQILESKHRILCVHGDGGIGKSTLVQSLVDYLPDGSVVVTFDCYGAGTYLNAGQLRHQHEHALTQIGNELAVTSGTELLLNREMSVENLIRWFRDKLEYVARSTQSDFPQALVVVVVDAADNSVSAARQKGERSFVTELVTCQIPDGCRLVVTCRSHRRPELGLPSQADHIPLQPFNLDESRQNLCRYFESPSSEKVQEFHSLSRGIPRVQGYALDGNDSEIDSVLSRLRPDGKSLDSVLSIGIEEAILKCGDRELVSRVCQALVLLPRPVPPEFAARFARVDPIAVVDVTTDLGRGLICDDQGVQFRDEDFETYLTSEFSPDAEACERMFEIVMEHRAE